MSDSETLLQQLRDTWNFYYLACPYTAPTRQLVEANIKSSLEIYGMLVANEVIVYHPTHTTHHAAMAHKLPTDHVFWSRFNEVFITASAGIIVTMIPGWSQSRGIAHEIASAMKRGLPIFLASIENDKLKIARY